MIYRTDLKCGPQPVPFGSLVTIEDGAIVVGDHRNMVGVAVRARWARNETEYPPHWPVRVQTEGHVLALVDPPNAMAIDLRKGKIAS